MILEKLVDLDKIQDLIEGKEFLGDNNRSVEYDLTSYLLSIKIAFTPLDTKISKAYCQTIAIPITPDDKVFVSDLSTLKKEEAIGFLGCNFAPPSDKVDPILDKCDSSIIFKAMKDEALSELRRLFPVCYNMFTSSDIYYSEEQHIPGGGENTLYVVFDKRRRKFKFSYNPRFILKVAISQYTPKNFKTLHDCYAYFLEYMICHEMMHIVTNNSSSMGMNTSLNLKGSDIPNIVMDSFINCKINGLFEFSKFSSGLESPGIDGGIYHYINLRTSRGRGLKKNVHSISDIAKILSGVMGPYLGDSSELHTFSGASFKEYPKEIYDCDALFSIFVGNNQFRESSMKLQSLINSVVSGFFGENVYSMFTPTTREEAIEGLPKIPIGSKVRRVLPYNDVCYVKDYDSVTNTYTITKAVNSGVVRDVQDDGSVVCHISWSDSGEVIPGKWDRISLIPFDDSDRDNTWVEGSSEDKKDNSSSNNSGSNNSGSDNSGLPEKRLNIGDIVYIRSKKKFGKITSINVDGTFDVDEVVELPPVEEGV